MNRLQRLLLALGISSLAVGGTLSVVGAQDVTRLNLTSQNNSGINGTATLSDMGGGKLRIEIQADGAGAGPQPAHVHAGTCSDLNPTPSISLTSVTNGSSMTEVDGSLLTLTSTPHAIHMHKSPDELPVYVACADISAQPRGLPRTGAAGSPAELLTALSGVGLVLTAGGLALRRIVFR